MLETWLPVLKTCALFADFEPEAIRGLLPCFGAALREFQKGDILCQAGDPQQSIGIVLTGEIQVQKEDYAGNRLIIGLFGPGDLFGEVSVFAGLGHWPNTVLANSAGMALFIPVEKISQPCGQSCGAHQHLIRNMLGIVAGKAIIMNSRISFLKLKGMREKLAAYLYEQYRRTGSRTFLLPLNRDELADYLNVSRPSMSRELGRMRELGMIDYYRSSFTIKDLETLRKA